MVEITAVKETALLNLHLEPDSPIEIGELTSALGSLARQYQSFAALEGVTGKAADGRLLISHVKPGSIDINLVPDFVAVAISSPPMIPMLFDRYELLVKFAERIRTLLDLFLGTGEKGVEHASAKECEDAVNIVRPTASHGGQQTINVYKDATINNILSVNMQDARRIIENANVRRAELVPSAPETEYKQRTAMVWTQLARDAAKTDGAKSPDKGLILEIDPKPHPVFFADELAYLKKEMIDDEENPLQKMFFVDVDIVRIPGGKVGNYRIVGYHGKDDL